MANRRALHVERFDDGVDRWEMASAAPAERLAGRIDSYCAYAERTCSFSARRELAGTTGVLIFALGDPLEIVGADGDAITLRTGEAFAGGIADATSISRAHGPQRGIHVFMPLASLAAVIGAPAGTLANCVAPLDTLLGAAARDLGARLADTQDHDTQFDLLDAFLGARLADARASDASVAHAMAQLKRARPPAITELAADIGWSRKHLASRFRAETGFSPQDYRRLARFERLAEAIADTPGESLAMLAVDAGYHDQAHMTREVQAFSAMTPGELRARQLPTANGVRED